MELKDKYDLYGIWRIKHFKNKIFAFRQKHFYGFIQQRLDYISVLQSFQERTRNVDILNAVLTDHLPVFSLLNSTEFSKSPGIWKFNNSLIFLIVKEIKSVLYMTLRKAL